MAERATYRLIPVNTKNSRPRSRTLDRLHALLSLDPYRSEFADVSEKVRELASEEQARLLRLCETALRDPDVRSDEGLRVTVAKLLVALIPRSLTILTQSLDKKRGRAIYEVHFTLFCYLDEVQHQKYLRPWRRDILRLVSRYLKGATSNKAMAAWMAGDLLGDHWTLSESLPLLIRIAKSARHVSGRRAAIHGLEQAFTKSRGGRRARIALVLRYPRGFDGGGAVGSALET